MTHPGYNFWPVGEAPVSSQVRRVCRQPGTARVAGARRGSVLIIVIWVCLGLVALTVYFANSMSSELRAAANRVDEIAARQAVAGGTRYAAYVLGQFATNGAVPHIEDYKSEDLPVGDASFWFVGRDPNETATQEPVFGLVDEASKLNLNTATRAMLEALPGMTPELADAIITWRSTRAQASGSENTYARLEPPRLNKAGPFETVDELRLVYGATLEILFGEDTNRNGVLDENENDGDQSAPRDNSDGLIQPGILEYVTVYSRQPNTRPGGGRRINISTPQTRPQLVALLQRLYGGGRAQQIVAAIGTGTLRSVAEFMVMSRLNSEEFARIRNEISVSSGNTITGGVNVNTASETVLACIPGIGLEYASAITAYRLAHPDVLTSFAWLTQVLPRGNIVRAGPYITDQSYQFCADVVGVAHSGRGYCRERTIFDMTRGTPRIVFHQDFTAYGWALGAQLRQSLKEARDNRT